MMDFENETRGLSQVGTGGAVMKRNEKGELTMEKVKVSRYVAGKRPDYAVNSSDESDTEDFKTSRDGNDDSLTGSSKIPFPRTSTEAADRRLKRLYQHVQQESSTEKLVARRRREREVEEPEIVEDSKPRKTRFEPREKATPQVIAPAVIPKKEADSDHDDDDLDEEEIQRRRNRIKQKALSRMRETEEILAVEDEEDASRRRAQESEEEISEYEEMSSSDDETSSRLKPVFISKSDRMTAKEREKEKQLEREREREAKRVKEDRRREALRVVEQIRKTEAEEKKAEEDETAGLDSVRTDDEDEELAYEEWKVRELKRIKRDRDLRERLERERDEIEKIHEMTEEERKLYLKNNPAHITNKMPKGKYKFLQKYYHRGAFYLDQEEDVFKRDIAQPTLEDHFDKTVLPKVMQVKNFGRSGRTKYTHLVDQDTSEYSGSWNSADNPLAMKMHMQIAGGMKEVFDRPSLKKDKKKSK